MERMEGAEGEFEGHGSSDGSVREVKATPTYEGFMILKRPSVD